MSAARKRPAARPGRGAAASPSASKAKAKLAPAPVASVNVETVAARLLALLSATQGATPVLWRQTDLGRVLSRAEKPHLDAALARLQADGQLLALAHGAHVFSRARKPCARGSPSPAAPLASPLAPPSLPAPPVPAAPAAPVDLLDAYRRLVRESGGFPDVRILLLARALGPTGAAELPERLRAAWRAGDAMLSLGDWSLASEEMRAAAVELDGEKYLLVRFEEG